MKKKNPFIEYLETRGNAAKLADALSIDRSAITQWGGTVPLKRVHDVARHIGCEAAQIRPDFFGVSA